MIDWKDYKLSEAIRFNPSERLKVGSLAKKIDMAKLSPFEKKVAGFEIATFSNGPKFRNGDTLLAKITPCLENGKTAQIDVLDEGEVGFGTSEFIVLREGRFTTNDFIFYLAKSPTFRKKAIICMDGTSGRKRVNESALKLQSLPIPDITSQKKIAAVLSALDAKIELNNRINRELEAMAKTIYDYWFVQFEFPDANGRPYKTSGGRMTYNTQLKRQIPTGWEVKKLLDWISGDKSGDWGKDAETGNYCKKVSCIRGADISGLNGLQECDPPVRFILPKNSQKVLSSHELIVEISGGSPTQSTGRLGFITDATLKRFDNPVICSNFCKAISLKDKKLLYNFAYLWNSLYENGAFFGYEGKTSGIKNLLFDSFVSSFYTVVPENSVKDKFYDFMELIQTKKQAALAENRHLALLRDWLLPMLMNGQVTVE